MTGTIPAAATTLVPMRAAVVALVGLAAAAVGSAGMTAAAAHTEPDLVAVPAGGEATVSLKPNHGCGDSPTIAVSVRAPVEGAVAGEVEGWTAASTPDGQGRTVLEWTGGVLPSDQEGAFPITFTAPDTVGELLTFPSIQACENGEELAWISGDPASQYPAPRILVLPPGSAPATTIDEVPADAPGRAQLTAIVDIDDPNATTTTPTSAPATTATTEASSTSTATSEVAASEGEDISDEGDDANVGLVLLGVGGAAAAVAGGAVALRRRRSP
jgi:periplasmic copper chaperone A